MQHNIRSDAGKDEAGNRPRGRGRGTSRLTSHWVTAKNTVSALSYMKQQSSTQSQRKPSLARLLQKNGSGSASAFTSASGELDVSSFCEIDAPDLLHPQRRLGRAQDWQRCKNNISKLSAFSALAKATSPSSGLSGMLIVAVLPATEGDISITSCLEDVSHFVAADLELISFEDLDSGEPNALELFYSSNVAIVDMSNASQQVSLFYRLGIRESVGGCQTLVLFPEQATCSVNILNMKVICPAYTFLPYHIQNKSIVCKGAGNSDESLSHQIHKALLDMRATARAMYKEMFLKEVHNVREKCKGQELQEALGMLKKHMDDDPRLFSPDIVLSLLLCYRDIQQYDAMVQLVESLPADPAANRTDINQHYAFALNRRNNPGDRERAIQVLGDLLAKDENQVPDMLCLYGRIYKDKFVESEQTDKQALKNAVEWYQKGFDVQPNEYAGINLATLLVVSGHKFKDSMLLQRVCMALNNLIGKKGSLEALHDYWDLATFFEVHVLAEEFSKACLVAERMFEIKPANWCLKSTLGNINLIMAAHHENSDIEAASNLERLDFWLHYFRKVVTPTLDNTKVPVLYVDEKRRSKQHGSCMYCVPCFLTIQDQGIDEDSEPFIHLWHACYGDAEAGAKDDFMFTTSSIRKLSLYQRDDRCLFLFVRENADEFQIFFPVEEMRQSAYEKIEELNKDVLDDAVEDDEVDNIEFDYDLDDNGQHILLGSGTFGNVFQVTDSIKQRKMAVKEVQLTVGESAEALHDEIRLHSHFRHQNIVRYYGSSSDEEDGILRIFMELVPGGSLSSLLKKKLGPLADNMPVMSLYTTQIAEGLRYLHSHQVVHRDIKGENVLVNTYTGVLKISDFGTSRGLSQVSPKAVSLKGTCQFMAPEVIVGGQQGYGPKADVWSLGCTVIEMATAKPPFMELGSTQATLFHIGMYKSHPPIPEGVSDYCREFLLQCFAPDPEQRPTCADLLNHSFLTIRAVKRSCSSSATAAARTQSAVSNRSSRSYMHSPSKMVTPPPTLSGTPSIEAVSSHDSNGSSSSQGASSASNSSSPSAIKNSEAAACITFAFDAESQSESKVPTPTEHDRLQAWLADIGVGKAVQQTFAQHELTFPVVAKCMSKEDLRQLRLKVGPQCMIWHAIQEHRHRVNLGCKDG